MKKVLLILGIIEGRDWNPKEGSKALIEAHLDNHKLSTNIFPLSNSPKIHEEVTWETGKQTIRSYKLGRVPIKLECFALDDKDNRKLLGYIVLPLTSAVEGIQADSKWYRLLGGAKGTHKTAPSILLRLHLETMTFDQHTQVNGKQTQGTRDLEDARMQSVFEKKKVAQDRINPMTSRQTNGNEDYAQYPPLQVQNSQFTTTSNGNCVDGNIIDEMDSDLEEDGEVVEEEEEEEEEGELLDSEKECSDEDQNDTLGMIGEAYSLNESMEEGEDDCSLEESEKNENTGEERLKMQRNSRKTSSDSNRNIEGRIFEKASTSNKITKGNSDHKAFMMARTSLREELQKHSESIKVPSPEIQLRDSSVNYRNKSFEKRILDTSNMLDRSLRRNKILQMDNSKEGSFAEASRGSSHSARDECDLSSDLKRRLSQCKGATFAGMVLSQSFETAPKPPEPQQKQSEFKYSYTEKLVAELNPEESCFYIGPKEEEMEEFTFSVTILYAKNLSKIVPGDFISTAENGFHFQYSLLGCPINTDPFYNLDSPEFVAEKATAKIRSTPRSLFLYFSQNYNFPVRFMSGDYSLGMFTVDVGFLIDIASKNRVKFQDVFEINSVSKSISTNSDSDKHSAIAAISIEVCKSSKSDIIIPSVNKLSLNLRRPTILTHNPISISENESSCSDHEEELRFKNKGRTRKKRARFSLRDYLHEDERVQEKKELESGMKKLLLEAAYEVERWKEEQQKHFLKEWKAKEETLQALLASEWTSKIKIIEEELSHRLTECDKLQEKLNSGLEELSLREGKFKAKENQVKRLEQEMLLEKEQFHASKLKENQQEAGRASSIQCRRKADDMEKQRNERLHKEVLKLEEDLKRSEELVRSHREEVISLRRKLLLTGDIIGVTKEKEILHNKIETLQERKQYYKSQWLSALTDLHRFHAAHKKAVENLTIDGKFRSDLPPRHVSLMEPSSAAVRLKKLKDERKLLLDTGFYPLDHSIIKNIDKKIKEVVG